MAQGTTKGVPIDTDATLSQNSDLLVSSQRAGKTYMDARANATHTGEVTGATSLTLDKTAITNRSSATVASGDLVVVSDIDDSNNLKKVTAQEIADLAPTIFLKMASNLATTSNTVNTTITDLAITVTSGKSYWISANLIGQADATTTGFTITFLSVATAAGNVALTVSQGGSSSEGASGEHQGIIRTLGGLAAFGQLNAANQNVMVRINGIFTCTTSGTIAPAFRSEVSGSTVTIYAGSIINVVEL